MQDLTSRRAVVLHENSGREQLRSKKGTRLGILAKEHFAEVALVLHLAKDAASALQTLSQTMAVALNAHGFKFS